METSDSQEYYSTNFELLFEEVTHILSFSERREKEVLRYFGHGSLIARGVNVKYQEPPTKTFFKEDQIKALCIKHRLRFLPSQLYCGEVPYEVIACIKAFEHKHSTSDLNFFLLAPSSFFLLKNFYASPLLFVQKKDGSFKLLSQWGDKLPWYIPILRFPMRDYKSLIISSLIFGLSMAIWSVFSGWMTYPSVLKTIVTKIPVLIISSGMFSTVGFIYGLLTKTDFSSDNWQNKFF